MLPPPVMLLSDALRAWARPRADIVGVALVGSYARGSAGPESDVDFVVLTTAPASYRNGDWPRQIEWPAGDDVRTEWSDVSYGALWARHLEFASGTRVEVGFAAPTWAQIAPVDPGTSAVVRAGCIVLWDPLGLLAALRRVVDAPTSASRIHGRGCSLRSLPLL
jgi:uncharacterized protein